MPKQVSNFRGGPVSRRRCSKCRMQVFVNPVYEAHVCQWCHVPTNFLEQVILPVDSDRLAEANRELREKREAWKREWDTLYPKPKRRRRGR